MEGTDQAIPAARPLRRRRLLLALVGLTALLLAVAGGLAFAESQGGLLPRRATLQYGGPSASGRGSLVEPARAVGDFTLPSQAGTPLALRELRGRAVLLFFGFTNCPDVCPTTLGEFKGVKRLLGPEADRVAFVFVSVDGERDTTDVLRTYVGRFDPAFIGLRGDKATLDRIAPDYDLVYRLEQQSVPGDYTVTHTASAFLIDPEGRLRVVFPYGTPAEALSTDVRAILAQP